MTENHGTHEIADGVAEGVERGVARSKIRLNDRRLLVMFLLLALFVILTSIWQNNQTNKVRQTQTQLQKTEQQLQQQQQAAKTACLQTNATNTKFNAFIDQAIQNANNTTGLTPAQKQATIQKYLPLHAAIVDCSKLAGQ